MILSAIAALSENRVIGKNNQLPWHLPADLKHFKALTTGHPIVMGRKTYDSIGKPLPQRTNIIMTRDSSFQAPGCRIVNSIEEAKAVAEKEQAEELFIIGGAQIYSQLLPITQRLYLTIVHQMFEGDAFFPDLNMSEWSETERETHRSDEKNPYDYSFVRLERIINHTSQ
ncbi:dihydrofolate reductase [Aquicella lusitana]|uniref:Dihydrofolate reductase n=1 Tax=Aquicella lusitana TaxID=254246 RepID=A0A370GX62_9COXI|nr:dihydrofolate reductase [Aquicella lusitana]RDI46503.1 dihydrofolate reductase [Aquicella lusitana]VVC74167.1 Dihydrofolate reductase [Aquicella lusitana]